MKILSRTIIKFSVSLTLILLFGQTVLSQEIKCNQISFDEILAKFRFNPLKSKSVEEINKELVNEIRENKVNFTLKSADQKKLKEVGANDLLIEAIRQNLREDSKEAILIYQKYVDYYESDNLEQIKIALDAAKEFVEKFENDGCYTEQVKYFKNAIPVLDNFHGGDPVHPKPELKWKTLKELEDRYKSKNYDQVFALGRKVYEIDPEFVPLFTVLASLGFDQAKLYGNKSKYNAETVFYAELAVNLLESSKKDLSSYGAFEYNYKTKAEALSKMKEILDFMKNQNLYKTNPESIK